MRRRSLSSGRGARGLAEIVGTLMLILIVISAAIVLAAFIASYQKQVQAEESQSQQRGLESLKILSITPVLNVSHPTVFANLSFVLASEYINPSIVESITLNGFPLRAYFATDLSNPGGLPTLNSSFSPLNLTPREEVVIGINLTHGSKFFGLYDASYVLTTSDYIELSVYTALQNTFTQVFIPPTAIAYVTTLTSYSGGGPVQIPVLDGTNSFQPGTNQTIVAWSWVLNDTSVKNDLTPYSGAEVELPSSLATGNYTATLTVTNSNQLAGIATVSFVYTAPS